MGVVSYKDTMKRVLKNPMRKTFSFLGVTLIVIVIFLLGALKPTMDTIKEIRAEIRAREEIDRTLQTKLNTIQSLQSKVKKRNKDLAVIEYYFPADSDYSLVLAGFEKITERYGFTMNRVSFSEPNNVSVRGNLYRDLEPVTVILNLVGEPKDVTRLLKHLEGLPIVPNVLMVSYSNNLSTDGSAGVPITIHLQIYRAKSLLEYQK